MSIQYESVLSAKKPFSMVQLPTATISKLDSGKIVYNEPISFITIPVSPGIRVDLDLSGVEVGHYFNVFLIHTGQGTTATAGRTISFRAFYSKPDVPGPVVLNLSYLNELDITGLGSRLATTTTISANLLTNGTRTTFWSASGLTGVKARIYVIGKTSNTISLRMIATRATLPT